jgi:hypothetical protein
MTFDVFGGRAECLLRAREELFFFLLDVVLHDLGERLHPFGECTIGGWRIHEPFEGEADGGMLLVPFEDEVLLGLHHRRIKDLVLNLHVRHE